MAFVNLEERTTEAPWSRRLSPLLVLPERRVVRWPRGDEPGGDARWTTLLASASLRPLLLPRPRQPCPLRPGGFVLQGLAARAVARQYRVRLPAASAAPNSSPAAPTTLPGKAAATSPRRSASCLTSERSTSAAATRAALSGRMPCAVSFARSSATSASRIALSASVHRTDIRCPAVASPFGGRPIRALGLGEALGLFAAVGERGIPLV